MSASSDLIYFFLPQALWPEALPNSPDENWSGFGLGMYTWTIQTYLRLKISGIACQLTSTLPEEGIVLCHSNALRTIRYTIKQQPAPKRFVICIKAEAPLSAIASMHIVQNPAEASPANDRYFIPHWPQPGLLPRSPKRGDKFENIAFFGHAHSRAPELNSTAWQTALANRQLTSTVVCNTNHWDQYDSIDTRWNDYRNIDAVVAVRSFNSFRRIVTGGFSNKPATKLYNAWLAGVIPVLGAESAYRETGQPAKNYVEVESFDALIESLDRLKSDVVARQTFLAYGKQQAEHYTTENTLRKWQFFFEMVAIPAYRQWCKLSLGQQKQVMIGAKTASLIDRAKRKGQRALTTKV